MLTPNELYTQHEKYKVSQGVWTKLFRRNSGTESQKYIVVGGGKTGMDAVVYCSDK